MKKLQSKVKISFSILTLLAITFSFFAFSDSGQYVNDGKVIEDTEKCMKSGR